MNPDEDLIEDLTTPEYLLHAPDDAFSVAVRLGGTAGRSMISYLSDPEHLAACAGATLLPLAVFRGRRPPFLVWLAVALIGDRIGVAGYRASRDLASIAEAARRDRDAA